MKINGRDLFVFLQSNADWSAIACSTSCTLEVHQKSRSIIKLNGQRQRWQESIPGKKGWSVEVEGLVNVDGADVMNLFGNNVTLRFATVEKGYVREGRARCTSIRENGRIGNMASYSATFIGTGGLSYA